MTDRLKEMKADKLESIARDLRRMIADGDEGGEIENNISAAIAYLDCARMGLVGQMKYRVVPTVVISSQVPKD